MGEAVLRVQKVSCDFDRWGVRVEALKDVSLTVGPGEWCMLVGPNGAGKSTLLNLVSGTLPVPNRGTVEVCGRPLRGRSPQDRSRLLLHVRQDPMLGTAPELTVAEHLAVADRDNGSVLRPLGRPHRYRYRHALERYGLAQRLDQPVATLSGGQRQLLTLVLARLRRVRLLLLDEGLAALDRANADACLSELQAFVTDDACGILMVTHDLHLATRWGHRVLGLNEGRLVLDSNLKERRIPAGELWERLQPGKDLGVPMHAG